MQPMLVVQVIEAIYLFLFLFYKLIRLFSCYFSLFPSINHIACFPCTEAEVNSLRWLLFGRGSISSIYPCEWFPWLVHRSLRLSDYRTSISVCLVNLSLYLFFPSVFFVGGRGGAENNLNVSYFHFQKVHFSDLTCCISQILSFVCFKFLGPLFGWGGVNWA